MTTCGQTPTGTWVITTSDNTTANSGYNAGPYVLGPGMANVGAISSLDPNPALLKLLENEQIFTREVMADILQATRKHCRDVGREYPCNARVIGGGDLFVDDSEVLEYFMGRYALTGIVKYLEKPTLPLIMALASVDACVMGMVDMTDWKPGECVKIKEPVFVGYGSTGDVGPVGPVGPSGTQGHSGPSWIDPNSICVTQGHSSSNFVTYSIKNATVVNTT